MPIQITQEELDTQRANEENTKARLITPIIKDRWDNDIESIVMEYYFTDGKVEIVGDDVSRNEPKRADYLLLVKNNIPLALVEAKGENHDAMEGYQQVIDYAHILDVPFAYTTNGHQLIEIDMITGKTNDKLNINDFPYKDDLWKRYIDEKGLTPDEISLLNEPYFVDTSKSNPKKPRYYQRIAINRTIEAVAQGKNRLLLVLATGTGKTFTAFQICYKLWKSKTKRKILYLVDRNALADQTMQKDFKPFVDKGIMVKIKSNRIQKDTGYEIYTALYQQLKSKDNDYYKQLPPDFFDFICVDECHRGSANENSDWHEILEYFSSATQLGMTATPKETEDTSNIAYFGEPIYVYSLKQGIEDGFLAPYKVISVELNIDKEGYKPHKGELDIYGKPLEKPLYKAKDFDRTLVVENRRDLVADKIVEYIKSNDLFYSKMIIFCENIAHADAMLIRLKNRLSDKVTENPKYIMKITGDDEEGKKELENFIDANTKYPVIAITSELLSTGVDTETVETIVLDKAIGSMTEFKQIIGRGTRIKENFTIDNENKSKLFFTILDFRGNYVLFNDPDFDGEPVSALTIGENDSFDKKDKKIKTKSKGNHMEQYYVNGNTVTIEGETVSYLDKNGKLVKENIASQVKNNILGHFETYQDFVDNFTLCENKEQFLSQLLLSENYVKSIREKLDDNIDKFDIVAFIGYEIQPISKEERLERIYNSNLFKTLEDEKQEVLKCILDNYVSQDYNELRDLSYAFNVNQLKAKGYSAIYVLRNVFNGNKQEYFNLIDELEKYLYM